MDDFKSEVTERLALFDLHVVSNRGEDLVDHSILTADSDVGDSFI